MDENDDEQTRTIGGQEDKPKKPAAPSLVDGAAL